MRWYYLKLSFEFSSVVGPVATTSVVIRRHTLFCRDTHAAHAEKTFEDHELL